MRHLAVYEQDLGLQMFASVNAETTGQHGADLSFCSQSREEGGPKGKCQGTIQGQLTPCLYSVEVDNLLPGKWAEQEGIRCSLPPREAPDRWAAPVPGQEQEKPFVANTSLTRYFPYSPKPKALISMLGFLRTTRIFDLWILMTYLAKSF